MIHELYGTIGFTLIVFAIIFACLACAIPCFYAALITERKEPLSKVENLVALVAFILSIVLAIVLK